MYRVVTRNLSRKLYASWSFSREIDDKLVRARSLGSGGVSEPEASFLDDWSLLCTTEIPELFSDTMVLCADRDVDPSSLSSAKVIAD